MNSEFPDAEAIVLPTGAVFRRCALQINPSNYVRNFRGAECSIDAKEYAKEIVKKAAELNVSVLAITDHNDVSGVTDFQSAAAEYDMVIFPGIELSSNEGIHVLCIYPPDTDEEYFGRILGEFGILKTIPSSEQSTKSFGEILTKVREQGGIGIAAHVTGKKGLFNALTGQARIKAWKSEDLLAIQIPGGVTDLPQDIRHIVENKDPEYQRSRPVEKGLALATINAKDISKPEEIEEPASTCWIKMSKVSIEGLRQAFLDPGSRIRLNNDPVPQEHAELLSLAWDGGFLDGTAICFNSNLNVLVGGRGAGKSTIVESLRYVLGLDPVGEEAQKAHLGMVRHVLRSGTKVTLKVSSHRPVKREYLIERIVPNPSTVRDSNGNLSNLLPSDILPQVEVYGQHEISELTRSGEKLTRLLDRFVQVDASLRQSKANLLRDLTQNRQAILNADSELLLVEERLGALPGLEETLKRFQEAGLEERLQERSLLVREERVIESIPEQMRTFREWLDALQQELPIDRVFLSDKALQDLPGKRMLTGFNDILERLSSDLETVMKELEIAITRADEGIDKIRIRWEERKRDVESVYQKILRNLRDSAVDGEEFIRVRGDIENLRPLGQQRTYLVRLVREHRERRRRLLAEWEEVKAEEIRLLDSAAKKVNKKLRNSVQVEVNGGGDREPLFQLLRDKVGGRLLEAIEKLRKSPSLSLPEFVECCQKGAASIKQKYGLPITQGKRLAEASLGALMSIEELELPPTTSIRLNTAPGSEPPSWQGLESLSTGQKATAVLLLLLLESEAPLIIDQPEDDLDNRFITEGIVPKMREEKRRRQFIFSTHNANIPVLGDAELILGLTAKGEASEGKARVAREHAGSIDIPPVRELVENLLEGGKDAFETRRLKYGF